jgi:hypothetical protein
VPAPLTPTKLNARRYAFISQGFCALVG